MVGYQLSTTITKPSENINTKIATHHLNPFHNVGFHNNKGCRCLQKGDYQAAIPCWFKSALKQICSIFALHNEEEEIADAHEQLLPMPLDGLLTVLPTGIWDDVCIPKGSESHYYTFTCGFPCVPGNLFFPSLTEEEGTVVSAIVVFNLALTMHMMAKDTGCPREWKRVQLLYSDALWILGPFIDRESRASTRNAAFDLLSLALLNNKAITHHWECQEFVEAERAFVGLADLSAQATSSWTVASSIWSEDDQVHQPSFDETLLSMVQNMLLNATVGTHAATFPAPAA